jgi:predicted RNase H-like HicB family nuclease
VATGDSEGEVERLIREAIALHLEGIAEDGIPIPEPTSRVECVEVDA